MPPSAYPTGPRQRPTDPLSPPPPECPYRDQAGAWVLSRYSDVLAALRASDLYQVAPQGRVDSTPRERVRRLQVRDEVAAAITHSKLAEWRERITPLAQQRIAGLPRDRPVDLLADFVQPLSLALALIVLDPAPAHRDHLTDLHRSLFARVPVRPDSERTPGKLRAWWQHGRIKSRRRNAKAELMRFFRVAGPPGGEALFLGISDTLPRFLANALLALLRSPAEMARLRARPESMPRAVEELLRYGGLVHTLCREATNDVELGGVTIARGGRVILRPASANRDPDVFAAPDLLDTARLPGGHVSLGFGDHSCAGAALVRMAAGVVVHAFVQNAADAELAGDVEWQTGTVLVSPVALNVVLNALP